jgi:hypothetical protein
MIPLSENCHLHTQHKYGWRTFAAEYLGGRDPVDLAADYWRAWPGRIAWEKKQEANDV